MVKSPAKPGRIRTLIHSGPTSGGHVMATLRTAVLICCTWLDFDWIREGPHAVMHDITALLAMAMRQPREKPS